MLIFLRGKEVGFLGVFPDRSIFNNEKLVLWGEGREGGFGIGLFRVGLGSMSRARQEKNLITRFLRPA